MAISEEAYMFAERYAHFSNVHTIYRDLISGHYQPSVKPQLRPASPVFGFHDARRARHDDVRPLRLLLQHGGGSPAGSERLQGLARGMA